MTAQASKTGVNINSDQKPHANTRVAHYRLAHYTDSLYKSYEDRLISSEWQAALWLRQHKSQELDASKKRLSSQKGGARDYSMKIFELHKQLTLDDEEAQRMEGDKDQFLGLALESYRS